MRWVSLVSAFGSCRSNAGMVFLSLPLYCIIVDGTRPDHGCFVAPRSSILSMGSKSFDTLWGFDISRHVLNGR